MPGCTAESEPECGNRQPVLTDIDPNDITDLLINDPNLSIFKIMDANDEYIRKIFKCGSSGPDDTCVANIKQEEKTKIIRTINLHPDILGEITKIIDKAVTYTNNFYRTVQKLSEDLAGKKTTEERKEIYENWMKALQQYESDKITINKQLKSKLAIIRATAMASKGKEYRKPPTTPSSSSALAENILNKLINLKQIIDTKQVVLGSFQRDISGEYQAVIDYLQEQITKLQAIQNKDDLHKFIQKNRQFATELFERSDQKQDKIEDITYCNFFLNNSNINYSNEQQKTIIDLCNEFNQELAIKKKSLGVAGGKRKRRNSQKKKKNKSNRKKQRKSKASRKKRRN